MIVFLLLSPFIISRACICKVISHSFTDSICDNNQIPSSYCTFVIDTSINNLEVMSCSKLIISSENTLYIHNPSTINEIQTSSNITFVSNSNFFFHIKNLIAVNTTTVNINIDSMTKIHNSSGIHSLFITNTKTLLFYGIIQTVFVGGKFVCNFCSVKHLYILRNSDINFMTFNPIEFITLTTSQFNLYIQEIPVTFKIHHLLLDIEDSINASLKLLHSLREIPINIIDNVKDVKGNMFYGKIQLNCLKNELLYVKDINENIQCDPNTCVFQNNSFNNFECPYSSQYNNIHTTSTLIIKSPKWLKEWSNLLFELIVIDIEDNELKIQYPMKAQHIQVKSGKIYFLHDKYKKITIYKNAFVEFDNVKINILEANNVQLKFSNVLILEYLNLNNVIATIDKNIYTEIGIIQMKISNSTLYFSEHAKFINYAPLTVYLNEISISTPFNNYPVFINKLSSTYYINGVIKLLDMKNECIKFIRSNQINGIQLLNTTNVVTDKKSINAFVCNDTNDQFNEINNGLIECQVPTTRYNNLLFESFFTDLPSYCSFSEMRYVHLNFDRSDVIINFQYNRVIGKISTGSIITKLSYGLIFLGELDTYFATFRSNTKIEKLTLRYPANIFIEKDLEIKKLKSFSPTTYFNITKGSSLTLSLEDISNSVINLVDKSILTVKTDKNTTYLIENVTIYMKQTSFVKFEGNVTFFNVIIHVKTSNAKALQFNYVQFSEQIKIIYTLAKKKEYISNIDKTQFIAHFNKLYGNGLPYVRIDYKNIQRYVIPSIVCNSQWIIYSSL